MAFFYQSILHLVFQGEFDLINSSPLARFAFKVKSTAQKGVIRVTPVSGVVEPRQTVKVAVTMLHSTIGYASATNNWLGHRILVQSVEVPKNCADLDMIWSSTPWRSLKATKLNCVFPVTQRRSTLPSSTAVSRRVAQLNGRATTVTGGILVGSGAAMTGVTQRRMRRKNVTVASQTKTENNPWAATVNPPNQNDWSIVEDKENAAFGDENAWGAQDAWAEDGGDDGTGIQDNVADNWAADNNAAATDDAWGTDQNNGATTPAADEWGNAQNNNDNDDWGANGGGDAQVNNDAWGFDNNAAPAAAAAVADDGWAVDNPATAADGAAVATDNVWPVDNNNANAWNNNGETAWNNDNYSATAGAAGDYGGGQGAYMTYNHGRVIVAFKVRSAPSFTFQVSPHIFLLSSITLVPSREFKTSFSASSWYSSSVSSSVRYFKVCGKILKKVRYFNFVHR